VSAEFTRRDFIKTGAVAAAGLTIAVSVGGCSSDAALPTPDQPFAPDAWIRIDTDGIVTVMVDRSEMGQGITTGLPMLVADELDADWSLVRFERAGANRVYANPLMQGMQGTGGSSSIRAAWVPLREGAARAKAMLVSDERVPHVGRRRVPRCILSLAELR
jgi:isoquinoline 1-oxidoreductase beta subunit